MAGGVRAAGAVAPRIPVGKTDQIAGETAALPAAAAPQTPAETRGRASPPLSLDLPGNPVGNQTQRGRSAGDDAALAPALGEVAAHAAAGPTFRRQNPPAALLLRET